MATLTESGKNFLQFVAQATVTAVTTGEVLVTEDERLARLNVCAGCPQQREGVCNACGCVLSNKARFKASTCPADKWVV